MDWLDQYLHELHRPGAVVHLPPDKQSWHAPNPTKQQLSLMQDATVADMVRMRNIQEARQAEMDAGMGGAYDAGSAARERTTVSPVVPAGIPVASTASVIVASVAAPYGEFNETYTKKNNLEDFTSADGYTVRSSGGVCYVSSSKKVIVPPNVSLETDVFGSLGSRNYWSLANLLYDDGNLNWAMGVVAPFYNYAFRNDSTNASFIPQSSYRMYDMALNTTVFSSPLTITAA